MKLNLGCGQNKRPGFVNVDAHPAGNPDVVFDLETFPWPWPDSSAQLVVFHHSLEHMGRETDVFLGIFKELYRVCAPGAAVEINVPHPRHDHFASDPTHVRAITADTLRLFDRRLNEKWAEEGVANTPLALYAGVDFEVTTSEMVLDEPFAEQLKRSELTSAEAARLIRHQYNIVRELRIKLTARK